MPKNASRMKKIPRFTLDELAAIRHLLAREGIFVEDRGETTGISSYGASTEYHLLVKDENYADVIAILCDYFAIQPACDEGYRGDCPACQAPVDNALACPGCGLSLALGTPDATKRHRFYQYLEEPFVRAFAGLARGGCILEGNRDHTHFAAGIGHRRAQLESALSPNQIQIEGGSQRVFAISGAGSKSKVRLSLSAYKNTRKTSKRSTLN